MEATEVTTGILVTTAGAAALLAMSETGFRTQLAAGRIGPREIRFGKSVRYCRTELERWAAAGCPKRIEWQSRKNRDED